MKTLSYVICLILFSSIIITAQEGLHLVGTITGTSEQNKVSSARGIGDFNGDGYTDFIVEFLNDTTIGSLTYSNPNTNVYIGTSNFDTIPYYIFRNSVAYTIGDVNNDGYNDLMVYKLDYSYYPPMTTFYIYKGGQTIDTIPIFQYTPPYLWKMGFSDRIENIGDLNGDGYRDFIISSPYNWDDGRGRVYVFHGGDTLSNQPVQILSYNYKKNGTAFFGSSVTGIDDINEDGKDDILIYEKALDGDSNNVQLYYGSEKLDSIPDKILMQSDAEFGVNIKNAGDLNKDEKTDFIISGLYVYIYRSLDDIQIINPQLWGKGGFNSVGCGGDINNDGYDDYLIGNTNVVDSLGTWLGAVYGYWGGNQNDTIPSYGMIGEKRGSEFGKIIEIAGDINKDNYDDVLIIAPSYPNFDHPIGKVYIYSYKTLSSVENNDKPNKVEAFQLKQNYPNPFNPTTTISYALTITSNVAIKVFDTLGKQIALIDNGIKTPGEYKYTLNSDKYRLSSGTYFIEIIIQPVNSSINLYHKVLKAVLLK